jgi:hypothetical protein
MVEERITDECGDHQEQVLPVRANHYIFAYPLFNQQFFTPMSQHHATEHNAFTRWEELLTNEGFPARFIEAGTESPTDLLLVGALMDEENVLVQLELSFIPGLEEQLAGASLLQYFAPIATAIEGTEGDLMRLILLLDSRLPLVGFSYLEEERLLFFRHIGMIPSLEASNDTMIFQTTWMISYIIELYAPALAGVAAGTMSYQEALKDEQISAIL